MINFSAAMSAVSRPGRESPEVMLIEDESYVDRTWSLGSERGGRPASSRWVGGPPLRSQILFTQQSNFFLFCLHGVPLPRTVRVHPRTIALDV
jgi:hypothetical protein